MIPRSVFAAFWLRLENVTPLLLSLGNWRTFLWQDLYGHPLGGCTTKWSYSHLRHINFTKTAHCIDATEINICLQVFNYRQGC